MKKALSIAMVISILALGGCGGGNATQNEQSTPPPTVQVESEVGAPEDDVDFELSKDENPDFDDEDLATDETPTEPIYIEVGDYVYRVDPVTLQPVGEPLDPDTLEPVDIPEGGEEYEETPTTEEPNDENKYPNTGVFEGDD